MELSWNVYLQNLRFVQRLNPLLQSTQALLLHGGWYSDVCGGSVLGKQLITNTQVKEVTSNTLNKGAEHRYLSKASQYMHRLNARFILSALFNLKKDPLEFLRGKCFQETYSLSLFPEVYTSRDSLVRAMFWGPKKYNKDYWLTGVKEKTLNNFSRHQGVFYMSTIIVHSWLGFIYLFFKLVVWSYL